MEDMDSAGPAATAGAAQKPSKEEEEDEEAVVSTIKGQGHYILLIDLCPGWNILFLDGQYDNAVKAFLWKCIFEVKL